MESPRRMSPVRTEYPTRDVPGLVPGYPMANVREDRDMEPTGTRPIGGYEGFGPLPGNRGFGPGGPTAYETIPHLTATNQPATKDGMPQYQLDKAVGDNLFVQPDVGPKSDQYEKMVCILFMEES